jgi:hypothetical protein
MQVIHTLPMPSILSEYPLSPDYELHMEGEALWIEGVGPIGQYYSYFETLWEKGIPYFIRDVYFAELEEKQAQGARSRDIRELVNRINLLNSKIRVYEAQCHTKQSSTTPNMKSDFQISPGCSVNQAPSNRTDNTRPLTHQ